MLHIHGKQVIEHEENMKKTTPTTWDADWDSYDAANHSIIKKQSITKWTTYLFVISKPWVHSQRFRSDSEV